MKSGSKTVFDYKVNVKKPVTLTSFFSMYKIKIVTKWVSFIVDLECLQQLQEFFFFFAMVFFVMFCYYFTAKNLNFTHWTFYLKLCFEHKKATWNAKYPGIGVLLSGGSIE